MNFSKIKSWISNTVYNRKYTITSIVFVFSWHLIFAFVFPQPAITQLRDMETLPDTSIHLYTLCIIVFLVFSVLFGIIFSTVVNGSLEDFASDAAKQPMHRRFNRAVAMRSIKMGMNMNPRSLRFKKYHT